MYSSRRKAWSPCVTLSCSCVVAKNFRHASHTSGCVGFVTPLTQMPTSGTPYACVECMLSMCGHEDNVHRMWAKAVINAASVKTCKSPCQDKKHPSACDRSHVAPHDAQEVGMLVVAEA